MARVECSGGRQVCDVQRVVAPLRLAAQDAGDGEGGVGAGILRRALGRARGLRAAAHGRAGRSFGRRAHVYVRRGTHVLEVLEEVLRCGVAVVTRYHKRDVFEQPMRNCFRSTNTG